MPKEQFEKDAEAMKKGFTLGPMSAKYRKMYEDKPAPVDASAKPKPARQKTIDDAEEKAVRGYKQGGMVRRGYGKARGC